MTEPLLYHFSQIDIFLSTSIKFCLDHTSLILIEQTSTILLSCQRRLTVDTIAPATAPAGPVRRVGPAQTVQHVPPQI